MRADPSISFAPSPPVRREPLPATGLPTGFGGQHLSSAVDSSPAAFVASRALALRWRPFSLLSVALLFMGFQLARARTGKGSQT